MRTLGIKLGIIPVFMAILALVSCNNLQDASINISENEAQKQEVFEQILNDADLFNEFMNTMMQESHTMHWMMEDNDFMHQMFSEESIDYMMQQNQWFNSDTMKKIMLTEILQRFNYDVP